MRNEIIAKRRNCKPTIAISPEGVATKCYSIAYAAHIGHTTSASVRKSIRTDAPVNKGWRFTEGT